MPMKPASPSATPMCTPSVSQTRSRATAIQPATCGETSSTLFPLHGQRHFGGRLAAPQAAEVLHDVDRKAQQEQRHADKQENPRRVEREADRAHGRLLDLPAVEELHVPL